MALVPVKKKVRGDLARLHDEMDELLGSFFGSWDMPLFQRGRFPAIDIAEDENEVVVKAEVPGCKPDDIDISIHGSTLTINGEKKQSEEKKERGYYHIERSYGSFRRDMNLPADVDTSKVEAACKDGILTVTLPKAEKAKALKVKIKGQ